MIPIHVTLTDKAHEKFTALTKGLGKNQSTTLSLLLEELDVEKFLRSEKK